MQRLKVYQSLWAMEQRRSGVPEDPAEIWFERIAAAGFDGVCLDPAVDEIDGALELRPLFEAHGLGCMINAFPHAAPEMMPLLELAAEMNACHVNAVGTVSPMTVREGAALVERWLGEAERAGVRLLIETHRDSLLNDLHYTVQLMDAVPSMRLCADLSHFVVDREMRLPLRARDAAHMEAVLSRSECFQGRVATREQIQVPIAFPQHQPWVRQFEAWWRSGLEGWRERNPNDAEVVFLCELGPPGYAITDAAGEELSDRWAEALDIRDRVQRLWRELERADQARDSGSR